MPQTDTPFKLLVSEFALDFAAWLLDVSDADVRHVHPLNVELPAGAVRTDTVFRVTLADGRVTLLHIEFQGRRSERPMPLRMLDYISRLAQQGRTSRLNGHLCSAVLYVGDGAGADDEGTHQVDCHDEGLTLAWRYRVIRLWQMQAEELLALDHPALLTLIGQTRIEEPERVLPQVIATIRQMSDEGERIRLFAALTSLMRDEEMLRMAEQLIEAMDQDLMLDTPFLRRIREEGRAEGRTEGQAEGQVRGRRATILDILLTRFELSHHAVQQFEVRIEQIESLTVLQKLVIEATRVETSEEFAQVLDRLNVEATPA